MRTVELDDIGLNPVLREVLDVYRAQFAQTSPNLLRRHDYQRWSHVIDGLPGGSLLDVGIGVGQFVHAAARTEKFTSVTGVDIRPHSKLLRPPADVDLVWATAADMPFPDDHFDVVTCMECLEHLDDETFFAALSELRRVTRHLLVVTVPWEEPEPLPAHHVQRFEAERVRATFPNATVTLLARVDTSWSWALVEERMS